MPKRRSASAVAYCYINWLVVVAISAAVVLGQTNPCLKQRDHKGDIERWTRVLETNPTNVQALICRGIAYVSLGDRHSARADFDRAIELDPASANAFYARGGLEATLGRYERAVSDFTRAIQFKPAASDAYYSRGRAYKALDKLDLALSDFRTSAELKEDDFLAYSAIGSLYVGQRENDIGSLWLNRAIEILGRSISKSDPATCNEFLYRARGYTELTARRYNDAFRDLNEALRLDPASADSLRYRASVYLDINAPAHSLTDMNRAIQLSPIKSEYYDFRAHIHDTLKNKDAAAADRAKSRELSGAK